MHEDDYCFLAKPMDSPHLPSLIVDKNTSNRNFRFDALPLGQKPLVFSNYYKAENAAEGIVTITPPILFDGTNLIVDDRIREVLLTYRIPDLYIYPAIYIDDENHWHEDRWYLTFMARFDCWDRSRSDYDREDAPIKSGDEELHNIFSLRLNEDLLERTPLQQRLLFKLGNSLDAYVFAHRSILFEVFGESMESGAEFRSVADF